MLLDALPSASYTSLRAVSAYYQENFIYYDVLQQALSFRTVVKIQAHSLEFVYHISHVYIRAGMHNFQVHGVTIAVHVHCLGSIITDYFSHADGFFVSVPRSTV